MSFCSLFIHHITIVPSNWRIYVILLIIHPSYYHCSLKLEDLCHSAHYSSIIFPLFPQFGGSVSFCSLFIHHITIVPSNWRIYVILLDIHPSYFHCSLKLEDLCHSPHYSSIIFPLFPQIGGSMSFCSSFLLPLFPQIGGSMPFCSLFIHHISIVPSNWRIYVILFIIHPSYFHCSLRLEDLCNSDHYSSIILPLFPQFGGSMSFCSLFIHHITIVPSNWRIYVILLIIHPSYYHCSLKLEDLCDSVHYSSIILPLFPQFGGSMSFCSLFIHHISIVPSNWRIYVILLIIHPSYYHCSLKLEDLCHSAHHSSIILLLFHQIGGSMWFCSLFIHHITIVPAIWRIYVILLIIHPSYYHCSLKLEDLCHSVHYSSIIFPLFSQIGGSMSFCSLFIHHITIVPSNWRICVILLIIHPSYYHCSLKLEVLCHAVQHPSITFPWASHQIHKIAGCACAGNARNVFLPAGVSGPDMHHGTCLMHVPWCMLGLLTSSFRWNRW